MKVRVSHKQWDLGKNKQGLAGADLPEHYPEQCYNRATNMSISDNDRLGQPLALEGRLFGSVLISDKQWERRVWALLSLVKKKYQESVEEEVPGVREEKDDDFPTVIQEHLLLPGPWGSCCAAVNWCTMSEAASFYTGKVDIGDTRQQGLFILGVWKHFSLLSPLSTCAFFLPSGNFYLSSLH